MAQPAPPPASSPPPASAPPAAPSTTSVPPMPHHSSWAPKSMPRLLKATYLADGESLLRETRGTKLFYLPGPILFIVVFGFLTYAAATAAYGWPSLPALTSFFSSTASTLHGNYLLYLFAILLLIGFLFLFARYLRWIRTVYAVTNMRIIVQKGILSKDFDEIPILQVRGVD
ncbi:MAG: PH domain-containing protein, partial [Thermoplasmata archaeon]